jgi:uncharacterized membrane protein YraQ (UPF0718 family)
MNHKNRETASFKHSLKHAAQMIYTIIPMILAVVGLVGLFNAFISVEMIRTLFTDSILYDTFISTVSGAISVGQPVVSYIIGGELYEGGVSLYAVTAFILSFVTLGIIQLPLEYSLFGIRFTLIRNILSFVFAMIIAILTVISLEVI